ncbi:HIRAN domain-containing protein [Caenibacillus caldisaponilyticus]|uniref:HIRAN domain-containing protein n=1 Tax=Caenibacillus caldisaponilyticus TaxID=1674942 RepID=UPI0009888A29|nr:HIRAN domain-containing protein [Caenibacillus caldisaponilyticus]
MASARFVAIVGTQYYFGAKVFQLDQTVVLRKDKENVHDAEAIQAEIVPIGKVGYIANSVHTVPRGCHSAGRIYDTFEETLQGKVRFIVNDVAIVELTDASA